MDVDSQRISGPVKCAKRPLRHVNLTRNVASLSLSLSFFLSFFLSRHCSSLPTPDSLLWFVSRSSRAHSRGRTSDGRKSAVLVQPPLVTYFFLSIAEPSGYLWCFNPLEASYNWRRIRPNCSQFYQNLPDQIFCCHRFAFAF